MRYAQKIILLRRINPRNITYMPVVIFFTCLDLEQKSSVTDRHYIVVIIPMYCFERKLDICCFEDYGPYNLLIRYYIFQSKH